jgi:hypothetical protein
VRLSDCRGADTAASEITGTVLLEGERRSLAMQGLRWLAALWQRESPV